MKANSLQYSNIVETIMFNLELTYVHVTGKVTNRILWHSFHTKGTTYL